MPKYYKKKYYTKPKDKYSVEHKTMSVQIPATPAQLDQVIIPATATEGMRKVKHLIVQGASSDTTVQGIYWALVYVPDGYAANVMNLNGSMYEPNQNVLCAGIWDPTAGNLRVTSPTSRNLNSGDSIHLLLKVDANVQVGCGVFVQYAITY